MPAIKPARLDLLALLPILATAQDLTTSTIRPYQTVDDAPSSLQQNSSENDEDSGGRSIVNYYFIFVALAFAVFAAGLLFIVRRRRRAMAVSNMDLHHYQPQRHRQPAIVRTRYWNGRGYFGGHQGGGWDGGEGLERQEGLNEHGEAPPPYLPKRRSEENVVGFGEGVEGARDRGDGGGGGAAEGPAVPLQTLSRQDAGLKPPDYDEAAGRGDADGGNGEESSMMRPSRP